MSLFVIGSATCREIATRKNDPIIDGVNCEDIASHQLTCLVIGDVTCRGLASLRTVVELMGPERFLRGNVWDL